MLLQERKETRKKWPAEPEPIKIYAPQPNITSEGAATSEGTNEIPPTSHLPIISQDKKMTTQRQTWPYLNHDIIFAPMHSTSPRLSSLKNLITWTHSLELENLAIHHCLTNQPLKPIINLKYKYLQITHMPLSIPTLEKNWNIKT